MAQVQAKIEFHGGGDFYRELKQRVRAHLSNPRERRRAFWRMYAKSAAMIGWVVMSYLWLMLWAGNWWQVGLGSLSLGLATAGVGFNLTHDANHGSFPGGTWAGKIFRWSLDVIGGSSYVWRTKHNVVHHTFTNIEGADSDIDALPFARFSPDQAHKPMYRFQHFYIWLLYGLFAIKWHTTGDIDYIIRGKVASTPLRRPRGVELFGLVAGKLAFATWSLVVPMLLFPPLAVLASFGIASFVLAFTLAVTFQLAHCLEEADFSCVASAADRGRTEWARHQVETTVDFAPRNRLLAWYLGGLNFQIEHHLFSKVCHIHYPRIAPIVREVCERHGVRYQVHATLGGALASHTRWLREMGRRVAVPAVAAEVAGAQP